MTIGACLVRESKCGINLSKLMMELYLNFYIGLLRVGGSFRVQKSFVYTHILRTLSEKIEKGKFRKECRLLTVIINERTYIGAMHERGNLGYIEDSATPNTPTAIANNI
jgi:hypothetical protein